MKKETRKQRFNFVITEKERVHLQILQEYENKRIGRGGTTIGSILRKLVNDEVKRVLNIK